MIIIKPRVSAFLRRHKLNSKTKSLRKHSVLKKTKFQSRTPFLLFLRKKNERSIVTTPYNKFINYLMRKGNKDRYLNFFYALARVYKQKIRSIFNWKYKTIDFNILPKEIVIPSFFTFLGKVFRAIMLRLELRVRSFRKLEVKSTVLTAPWKGFRLGINLLLKNSKTRLEIFKRHRKVEYLYKLFDEIWDTYYGQSITSRNVVDFTDSVLKHSQHYKTSQFFTVWHRRRKVLYVGKKLFKKKMKKQKDGILTKFEKFRNFKKAKNFLSFSHFKNSNVGKSSDIKDDFLTHHLKFKVFNKFMDLNLTMRKENFYKAELAFKYKKSYMRSGKFPLTYHFLKRKKNIVSLKGKKKSTLKEKTKNISSLKGKKKNILKRKDIKNILLKRKSKKIDSLKKKEKKNYIFKKNNKLK